jgi:hypothetical protein
MTRTLLMLYLAVLLLPLPAFADVNSDFSNGGGTLFSNTSGTNYFLQMGNPGSGTGGSALGQVTGAAGLNCGGLLPACNGNVSWITPSTSKAGIDNVVLGFNHSTQLGAGGQFTIFEQGGNHGGIVFLGTFTNAAWTYVGTCTVSGCAAGQYYQWELTGHVSGIFYVNHQQMNVTGATIILSTQKFTGADPFKNGTGNILFGNGDTALPSVAPEPGTWAFLGTGLVGIGFLAKRRYLAQPQG